MNIWEEKNLIEQEMNCLNSRENERADITKGIESASIKNECKGIGKKKGPPFKTTIMFVCDAQKVHGNRYDYSKSKYINNRTKLEIICPTHGVFWQLPTNHLTAKRGCPKCGGILLGKLLSSTTEKFVEKSINIHGKKYDYSKVKYNRNCDRVVITCKFHGDFLQVPQTHLHGSGCPKCTHRISKSEIEFLNYCKVDESNRQKYIGKYLVDGFQDGIVYEFLGNYWHGNPRLFEQTKIHPKMKKTYGEIYRNTLRKFDEILSMGYTIKYIWEDEWKILKKRNFIEPTEITTYSFSK